jgi:hypothetical protein
MNVRGAVRSPIRNGGGGVQDRMPRSLGLRELGPEEAAEPVDLVADPGEP